MSYLPSRPATSPSPPDTSNPHGRSSSQQPNPSASQAQSSSTGQGQSPLDWANFINFPTPPVHNAGPVANGMRGGLGQGQQYVQMEQGRQEMSENGTQGGPGGASSGQDEYSAFAQGIAMNRQQPASISFQHPYPHRSSSTSTLQSQQGYQPQPSPHQRNLQLAPAAGPSRSPGKGKGKSPAAPTTALQAGGPSQHDNAGQDGQSIDNGLTLDPDAFSRDIRFQVPSFLSNQMTGAPSFPAGGEAWSGFGAGMFQDGTGGNGGGQLTPGTLFNNAFGLTESNNYGNEQSGGGRNVLDGLSGFMNDGHWDSWDKTDTGGGGTMAGNANGNNNNNAANNGQAPTTFYVNPNPSPNVLAQRAQQGQQPQQQQQPQQPPPHQHPHQHQQQHQMEHRPSHSGQQRPNLSNLDVNASQHQTHSISQSPRNTTATHPNHQFSPRNNTSLPNRSSTTVPSPHSSNSASMPTSAIFPQPTHNGSFYAPSLSTPTVTQSASTVNIASSSTQPYAPPANTQALLSGPALPAIVGPSLSDGPGLYSTTGFDMVGVLARVAGRKDPKTVLGPVDLSCSFLVVDVRRYDSPIVYASPTFQALTGYDLPQILGRNCRFLQSPDGEVVKGSKRKYTDNVAVAHLKRMLNAGKECQASLINYRRGGIPFINLVTVVPIPWEGTDIVYHVGFQVDLVEQPNAILRNMRDGSYQVNYTVTNPPQPMLRPPGRESGLGLSQEIIDILGPRVNQPGFGMGEEGGKMEWLKMVLENADDFIHVLSLKGLFQYVSPSVRRVLEYEPEDLLNKNISDICHPSDIVPLMRELKDSTHAPVDGNALRKVHLVFRIRRKSSGYVWIECNGRLHIEAGKGRKAVILSGRGLAVPTLPWEHVARNGGLSDNEAWMKVSFDGLILHTTSTINELVGRSVDKVVGQSIFSLMPGGENGPPPHHDQTSANARLASAFRTASSGETGSALTVRLQLLRYNNIVDVTAVIYPPRSLEIPSSDADDDSPMSDTSRRLSTSSTSSGGIKSTSLIVQIKVNSNVPNKQIAHPASTNVFEELETTRGTSWQYELHQLRLLNRRLKEDISSAKAKGKKGNNRKRKAENGLGEMGPPGSAGNSSNGASGGGRMSDKFTAAPRHQLTPGFGLIAPGTYYQ